MFCNATKGDWKLEEIGVPAEIGVTLSFNHALEAFLLTSDVGAFDVKPIFVGVTTPDCQ